MYQAYGCLCSETGWRRTAGTSWRWRYETLTRAGIHSLGVCYYVPLWVVGLSQGAKLTKKTNNKTLRPVITDHGPGVPHVQAWVEFPPGSSRARTPSAPLQPLALSPSAGVHDTFPDLPLPGDPTPNSPPRPRACESHSAVPEPGLFRFLPRPASGRLPIPFSALPGPGWRLLPRLGLSFPSTTSPRSQRTTTRLFGVWKNHQCNPSANGERRRACRGLCGGAGGLHAPPAGLDIFGVRLRFPQPPEPRVNFDIRFLFRCRGGYWVMPGELRCPRAGCGRRWRWGGLGLPGACGARSLKPVYAWAAGGRGRGCYCDGITVAC